MQAELDRDARRQIGDIYGAGMQQAFAQAQRGLDLDRAYADQAARLGQSAYQNLLAGDAQRIQGAGILGDFVDQRQRMEIDRLRNMEDAGRRERDFRRGLADARISGFLASKSVPARGNRHLQQDIARAAGKPRSNSNGLWCWAVHLTAVAGKRHCGGRLVQRI